MLAKNFFSFIIHFSFLKINFIQQEFCRFYPTMVRECQKQLGLTKLLREDEISETRALSIYLEEKREEIVAIDDQNVFDEYGCTYELRNICSKYGFLADIYEPIPYYTNYCN